MKFPKLSALLGLKSEDASVTDENMSAAEATIAQLEQDKSAAELSLATAAAELSTAQADLKTAQDQVKTATTSLTTAEAQVKTLEGFKKEQQAADASEDDESNKHEQPAGEALASFEQVAASAIANRKKVLG